MSNDRKPEVFIPVNLLPTPQLERAWLDAKLRAAQQKIVYWQTQLHMWDHEHDHALLTCDGRECAGKADSALVLLLRLKNAIAPLHWELKQREGTIPR